MYSLAYDNEASLLMGKILCKICCCCFHCRCCNAMQENSVGVLPEKMLKFLVLGMVGSGKSEISHCLTQSQRLDYESTNGVHNYALKCMEATCSLTEIGGNEDIQKIWHHYYAGTMGIIYCYDLSSNYDELKKSFQLFRKVLKDNYVAGKPILLVATKADIADESIQLYDIENTFQLHAIARTCGSAIKMCVYDKRTENLSSNKNLRSGLIWLVKYALDNLHVLQMRIDCDKKMKNWENQRNKLVQEGKLNLHLYQRFPKASARHKFWRKRMRRRGLVRPHTAPPKLSFVKNLKHLQAPNLPSSSPQISLTEVTSKVPNGVLPNNEIVTDV